MTFQRVFSIFRGKNYSSVKGAVNGLVTDLQSIIVLPENEINPENEGNISGNDGIV